MSPWRRFLLIALLSGGAAAQLGCDGGPPLARVSGIVSFEGTPLAEGLVLFRNQQEGVYITAKVNEGSYEVVTSKGKGLPPGRYEVAVSPPIDEHVFGPIAEPPKSAHHPNIPHRYRDASNSGFTAQLVDGENRADFEMHKLADTR